MATALVFDGEAGDDFSPSFGLFSCELFHRQSP
jgi:hypothetical protein